MMAPTKSGDRKAFVVPDGYEAVLGEDGRPTGEVRPVSPLDEVRGPCIPVVYCGLATSTHIPVGSDEDHCDLCGHPAQPYVRPQGMEVKVRPLEWKGTDHSGWEANSVVGEYVLNRDEAGGRFNLWVAYADDDDFAVFTSVSEAKDSAQADYEQRILSALEASASRELLHLRARVAQAQEMAAAILNGYPDPNIGHEDYRVQVARWADDFLEKQP